MPDPIRFRVLLESPPPGVPWALQLGRDELAPPTGRAGSALVFEFTLVPGPARAEGETPSLRGAAAQGPPAGRFVYLNSGQRAGDRDSPWDRRAKVPLTSITAAQLADAARAGAGAVFEARVAGTSKDGGPACATVPLRGAGWELRVEQGAA